MTLRGLLLGGGLMLLCCLGLMVAVIASSVIAADRYLARAGASQTQLTLVTRLEADANALLLHGRADNGKIDGHLAAYLDSIDSEARMYGPSDDQGKERRLAALLMGAFSDVRARDGPRDLAKLRDLVQLIGIRERGEVAAVTQDMERLRSRAILSALAVAALLSAAFILTGWALWRAVARPLRALEAGAAALAGGAAPVRVVPSGIAELRLFADRFNDMAGQVEAQVALRTAELETSNRRLAEIDRTRRLFFAKVSHELRTPVTVMRGEADVALRGGSADSDVLREALEHIAANGGFLQRRLDDLLGLARSEDGRIVLAGGPVDLVEVVRAAGEVAQPFARSSEVAIITRIDLPVAPVVGDAGWLVQSLLAIIDNGVKFAGPEGSIRIILSRDEPHARIIIEDSGNGVDHADLPRLFDPYFQTEAGRSRGGTGLGLALARWIVEQHGGRITAGIGDRGGLRISIDLPIAQEARAA